MPLPKPPEKKADRLPSMSDGVDAASSSPAPGGATRAVKAPARAKQRTSGEQVKLFVLDTNVLMHDPSALFRFEEHDVFLPMITLEELDGHKTGMTEVNRNVRQVARDLDKLRLKAAAQAAFGVNSGIALNSTGHSGASGRLFFQTNLPGVKLPEGLPNGKADNMILGVVKALRDREPGRTVVLVSKDINMRIKAWALGLPAEDYENDKVIEDVDLLYTGILELPKNFWLVTEFEWVKANRTCIVRGKICAEMWMNQFVYMEEDVEQPFYARVVEVLPESATLQVLTNHCSKEHSVFGIVARNKEQNFALNLLMDTNVHFVSINGVTGSGKTLMALAAGLTSNKDIIMTRALVPLGEDIGFLPGNEEEKVAPWMGALDDNLDVLSSNTEALQRHYGKKESGVAADARLNRGPRERVKIKSINFMRGRTFLNKWVIIDEAQNLTPKQTKALITRAGPDTKVVFLGNLAQIDTPYLTEGASGLTYVVDRFKGWPHGGHITLTGGERSLLATYAEQSL